MKSNLITPSVNEIHELYYWRQKLTCLQHLFKAEVGMLGGAIWSKTPPVDFKERQDKHKTVTQTRPEHKISALLTLQKRELTWLTISRLYA